MIMRNLMFRDKNISIRKIAKNRENKTKTMMRRKPQWRVGCSDIRQMLSTSFSFAMHSQQVILNELPYWSYPTQYYKNKVSAAIRQPIQESEYYFKPNKPSYCSTCIALADAIIVDDLPHYIALDLDIPQRQRDNCYGFQNGDLIGLIETSRCALRKSLRLGLYITRFTTWIIPIPIVFAVLELHTCTRPISLCLRSFVVFSFVLIGFFPVRKL